MTLYIFLLSYMKVHSVLETERVFKKSIKNVHHAISKASNDILCDIMHCTKSWILDLHNTHF